MRVICSSLQPARSGIERSELPLTEGNDYLVLAVYLEEQSPWGKGCILDVYSPEVDGIVTAHLSCFTISDSRVSAYWTISSDDGSSTMIAPNLFRERAFHDRLSDRDPKAEASFQRLLELMLTEEPGLQPTN